MNSLEPLIVALDEMGLDSSVYGENNKQQEAVFKVQLDIALEVSFPVIVHYRGSEDIYKQCLDILKSKLQKEHIVHFHWFLGYI